MVRIDGQSFEASIIAQAVAEAAAQPIEPDPGMGHWDGFDTGHPAERHYGVRAHGGALIRVRVVPGPSGPRSRAVEVIRVG